MTDFFAIVGILVSAYLIGSIPFGFLIGRLRGLDIRQHGSGNIGATNVTRVIGRKWGIGCFLLDFCKGLVPVAVAVHLSSQTQASCVPAIAALLVISGHVWPIFLHFRGGKGVATSIGALLAVALWPTMIAAGCWYIVFKLSRYVSLASLAAAITLPISAGLMPRTPTATRLLLVVVAVLIIVRHRTNIRRLLNGSESRFSAKQRK